MIDCDKVTISQLLKAMGITVLIVSALFTEVLYTYMQILRQFVGDRLFVFVNMRSYVSDIQFDEFIKTIINHGYQAIFLENKEYPTLENERRLIIDEDLCEIWLFDKIDIFCGLYVTYAERFLEFEVWE